MNTDTSMESMKEQRQLKMFKPTCYGLAAVCFSLTLQTLFADSGKIGLPFYLLMLLVIPLVIMGTLADILANNPSPRPQSASHMTNLCYLLIAVSAFAIGAALWQFTPILGIAFGSGLFLALGMMKMVESKISLDKENET